MYTYGALSIFWAEANSSGVMLRWIFSVPGCTGTQLSSGTCVRLRHIGLVFLVVFGKGGIRPLAPF